MVSLLLEISQNSEFYIAGRIATFSTASALAEWMALMITEARKGQFYLWDFAQVPLTQFEHRQRK